GCTTNGNRVGIGDRGTAGTVIMGNVSYANVRDGITVSYGARDGIISGNIIYKNVREGVAFNNDSRNPYTVTKNRIFENTLRGVYVPNATSPFSGLTITDNEIYRNGLHGVELSGFAPGGFSNPIVSRNRVFDNGQAAASRGFLFDCSASGFTIDANDVYDTQTVKTQTVAFKFSDSAAQTLVNGSVDGNKLAESVTPFSLGSAVRTNVSIQRNTGYATRTSGSGTLAIGAAAADFNHGLASGLTPTVVTLTPRGEGVNLYTNNRTGVIFRAARVGATTTALVFDWTAEA
ncbi:MAG: right-handed parallel beta-helix repeat-containing protein, partial [Actinomycetales bacterium]|nr:right-handed parallel beta-helix repeat-containing protein [Actinomycetales bacterium]